MKFKRVEPNLTTKVVADKNRSPLPTEIDKTFLDTNSAIDKLNLIDLPETAKNAKIAKVAEKAYSSAVNSLEEYTSKLKSDLTGFEKSISELTSPKTQAEIAESINWQNMLINGDPEMKDLVRKDPTLAKAAIRLPDTIAEKFGYDKELLKETVFPGYNEEMKRYEKLLDNAEVAKQHLFSTIKPLFASPQAIAAIQQIESFNNI